MVYLEMDLGSEVINYFHNMGDNADQVRKYYKVTEKDIKRDIKILKEWIKKQPHLPQDLEDIFFEKMLLFNKFRVERAKRNIDMYFTVKTTQPELYEGLENVRLVNQSKVLIAMPTLLPNNEILILWRLNFTDPELYNAGDSLQNWIVIYECAIKYCYVTGVYGVIDCKGGTLSHIKRMNLSVMFKMLKLLTTSFLMRVNSIDIINAPSFAIPVINACKSILSSKIVSKIHIYNNVDGLIKKIDPKYLPKDVGGTAESQDELIKKMDELIEKHYDYLKSLKDLRSDESKRVGEPIISVQEFGPQGTFKQINVD